MKRHAFTLVEMLVVITIIVILAALLFPAVTAMREKSNETKTKAWLTQIDAAIRRYQQDYGHYPFMPALNWNDTAKDHYGAGNWADGQLVPEANEQLYDCINASYLDEADLGTTTVSTYGGSPTFYCDTWEMPVIYLSTLPGGGNPPRPNLAPDPKPGFTREFELWSAGPDKMFEDLRGNDEDGDNVTATEWE